MAEVHGGQMVIRALHEEGVSQIFGICGGHIAPIYDAMIDSDISLISTRHEQAAVMMAEATGRLSGQPGVALVTAGPGFTNAITGIADAKLANVPLVVIAGSVATNMEDRLDLQDLNQIDIVKPLVKWARRVIDPERIPEALHEAFKQARMGSPGPVYIEVPADILSTKVDEAKVKWGKPVIPAKPAADPESVRQVIELLKKSQRPVLIAGSGVWYSRASDQLKRFAETTGVPTMTTSLGKGCLPDNHPMCCGPSLAIRPGAAMAALTQTDLLILVGTRISLFFLYGKIFNPAAKLVMINIDSGEMGRNRPADVPVVADAGVALTQLADAAGGIKPEMYAPWRETLKKAHDSAMQFFAPQVANNNIPIHPLRLCKELDDFLTDDDILVLDGGDTQIWMNMVRTNNRPGKTLESGLFGCLGVGLPFAIAAKLANPDKRVFIIIGDGSIGFNFMEMHTALLKNLPIVVVVNNDHGWGMVRHSQMLAYGKERCFGVELGDVPYHKLAEALGAWAAEVKRPEEIRPALEKAVASGKLALINVQTQPGVISPGSMALASIGKKE